MRTRLFLFTLLLGLVAALTSQAQTDKKVVILGIDGLDPDLLHEYRKQGYLPNFDEMIKEGHFSELQTSMSPQSPVAWSTFITGMDGGGHAIYDFLHRDPTTTPPTPYSSMSKSEPGMNLPLGTWVIPLTSGKVTLLRKGRAFWDVLDDYGIPSIIFRMPVNFPPVEHEGFSLAGMGTPDILGTPGTFSFFTEEMPADADEFKGGNAYEVEVQDGVVKAALRGPENPFRRFPEELTRYQKARGVEPEYKHPILEEPFTVYIDAYANAAKIEIGNEAMLLQEGEWSEWVEVFFEAIPYAVNISATARFYLKSLDPFQLYVTPLQINPADPAMPITNPADWSHEMCSCLGFFYTQEFPEDTKALTHGVFTGREFWDQAMMVYDEAERMLGYMLDHHKEGLLFFYFGTVDQGCHMLWRYMDEQHPGFIDDAFLKDGIRRLYQTMDTMLGDVRERLDDDTTLIVMSDHGFAPFYWGVNLNTWLYQNGYLALNNEEMLERMNLDMLKGDVDWSKTKAYAMGLNGLYINLEGREKGGIVPEEEYEALLDQLKADLLALRDPRNGRSVVSNVTIPPRDFHGPHKRSGPDILVGYNWGYRSSWENPLGEFTREVFTDNLDAWSGDHCIDAHIVPGTLISNRPITLDSPALYDLTVGVLDEFGVPPLKGMIGEDCLASSGNIAAEAIP